MLITTVAMVRVSHAGMKSACTFLERREGPQVRAANPTIMTMSKTSRRGEDFPVAGLLWDDSSPLPLSPCDSVKELCFSAFTPSLRARYNLRVLRNDPL
jgi:hypothetical protein